MLKKVEQEAADKLDATLFEQNLDKKNTWNSNNGIPGIFFGNGRRFYRGFEERYHFFTWWGGEESDVVFTAIFHFDTFSFILSTTIP